MSRPADVEAALMDLQAVTAAVRRIAGLLDSAVLATRASHEIRRLAGLDMTSIAMLDDPNLLVMIGSSGAWTEEWARLRFRFIPGAGMAGSAIARRQPVFLDDYALFDNSNEIPIFPSSPDANRGLPMTAETRVVKQKVRNEGMRGFVAVPIQLEGHVFGLLYAGIRSIGPLDGRARTRVIDFADQIAPALANSRQAQEAIRLGVQEDHERIAFNLHETIGQILFGIEAMAQRAQVGLPTEATGLGADLRRIEAEASRAASHLREALRAMSPSSLETTLATEIRVGAEVFSRRTGVPVEVVVIGECSDLSTEAYTVLLAAFREALHNVEKHARAGSVVATLHYGPAAVDVIVQDDGQGLPADFVLKLLSTGGHQVGLGALKRHLERLGGDLQLISNEDCGMTLRATVPANARPPRVTD